MDKWKDFLFLLTEKSYKENEVTGEDMGGTYTFVSLPVAEYKPGEWIRWQPLDGSNVSCSVTVKGCDAEKATLQVYNASDLGHHSHPSYPEFRQEGDEWTSGWYDWGSWSYCHTVRLVKKESVAK